MRFTTSLIAAASLALLAATPAGAQETPTAMCQHEPGADHPAAQIVAACTLIINGGELAPRELAIALVRRGDAYRAMQSFDAALADYAVAIPLGGSERPAYFGRASALFALERFQDAINEATLAIALDNTWETPWRIRGAAYNRLSDFPHAIADLSRAIELNPNIDFTRVQRGAAYVETGDFANALVDLNAALALNPANGDALHYRGRAKLGLNDYQGAIADFTEVIRIAPQYGYAYGNRGLAYQWLADYDRALEDLTRGIELTHDALYLEQRGRIYRDVRHDAARAIADHDEAARLAPTDANIGRACWTRALFNQGLDVARRQCDEAIRLATQPSSHLDSRGFISLREGRFQDAWNDYDAAVRTRQGNNAHPLYGRGLAALRLGRTAEGQADIAAATALTADIAQIYAGYGVTP